MTEIEQKNHDQVVDLWNALRGLAKAYVAAAQIDHRPTSYIKSDLEWLATLVDEVN